MWNSRLFTAASPKSSGCSSAPSFLKSKWAKFASSRETGEPLAAEVVGFTKDEVLLSPLGDMKGIGPSSEVIPMRMPMHIKVGPDLFGRVLNGLGQPLDEDTKGRLTSKRAIPVINPPPDPSNGASSTSRSPSACAASMASSPAEKGRESAFSPPPASENRPSSG